MESLSWKANECFRCHFDIFENLSQKSWRNIASGVDRNSRESPVRMPELFVRTSLPHLDEAHLLNDANKFSCLENRELRQISAHLDQLCADELPFKWRLTILQQHLDHFPKILVEFVERLSLRMRAGKTRNVADKVSGFGVAFDHSGECFHVKSVPEVQRARSAVTSRMEFAEEEFGLQGFSFGVHQVFGGCSAGAWAPCGLPGDPRILRSVLGGE